MNKLARKPSTDPIQEKLRASKQDWNEEVSSLIDDMIQFKKLMNGKPNKFFNDKSKIIDPIPANPNKILDNLAARYDSVANQGMAITKQQTEYSKNRKKKKNANINYDLVSEGSNVFTRMFTRLTNPTFGDSPYTRIVRYRKGMLNTLADLYNDLKKFEKTLGKGIFFTVTPPKEKVKESQQIFNKINSNWNMLFSAFVEFAKSTQEEPDELPESTDGSQTEESKDKEENKGETPKSEEAKGKEKPKKEKESKEDKKSGKKAPTDKQFEEILDRSQLDERHQRIENIKIWFDRMKDNEFFPNDDPEPALLIQALASYNRVKNPKNNLEKQREEDLFKKISVLIGRIKQAFEANKLLQAKLKDDEKKSKASFNTGELPPVLAAWWSISDAVSSARGIKDSLSRYLGFGGIIGPVVRDMINISISIRDQMNLAMDSLESGMNEEYLKNIFVSIAKEMSSLRHSMYKVVNSFLRGAENVDSYTSLLESGDITGEAVRLSDKERKSLKENLKRQRSRDLAKLYQGK